MFLPLIILTQRKEHVVRLFELINKQTDAQIITLIGSHPAKVKAGDVDKSNATYIHK